MRDVLRSPRQLFGGLPREVAILSSVSFTVALGYGIVAPSIPAFARQFGVSAAAAASVISAFALMRVVGALPAGRLVVRLGERRTMAAGIVIVATSSVLAGFSSSFAQLIVLRGIGGIGSAMFGVSGQTLLLSTVRSDQRGRASGLYTGGFLLGSISGPAIGGLVAAWSLRAPFFIYGAMLAVPAGIALAVLRDRPRRALGRHDGTADEAPGRRTDHARTDSPLAVMARVLRNRAYQAAAAANLADGFAVIGVRSAIVPLFVKEVLDKPPTWTGIGFGMVAALNAAVLLPAGRFADTVGRRPVVVAGCLGSAAGMATLAFAPGLWGFIIAMATLGISSGLLDVAPSAMIGDVLARTNDTGGTVVASYQMAGDIGAVTGPIAVGFLVDSVSYQAAFLLAAGVLVAAAATGLAAKETPTAASDPVIAATPTPAGPIPATPTPAGPPLDGEREVCR
jgi:DHA1 family multidrug resistance protein-like MFS transporter